MKCCILQIDAEEISFVISIVVQGFRRPLTRADLWALNPEDTSEAVSPPFEKAWMKEMDKYYR
jgi:hypothetical protein